MLGGRARVRSPGEAPARCPEDQLTCEALRGRPPGPGHSLVLHLVDVQLQGLQVLRQHPRHLEAVCV